MASVSDVEYITVLAHGFQAYEMLQVATELKIFYAVGRLGGTATAQQVALETGTSVRTLSHLLDGLGSLKLLTVSRNEDEGRVYQNSSMSERFLLGSSPESRLAQIMSPLPIEIMTDNLKEGLLDETKFPIKKNIYNFISDETLEKFQSKMSCVAETSLPLLEKLDLGKYKSCVDLGGGLGTMATHVKFLYPSMEVLVLEQAEVIQLARTQVASSGNTQDAVQFIEGDLFAGGYPRADLFILGHILHNFDKGKIAVILNNVYEALHQGGAVLVLEKVLREVRDGPLLSGLRNLRMVMFFNGGEHTLKEYSHYLEAAGFSGIKLHPHPGPVDDYYDAIMAGKAV